MGRFRLSHEPVDEPLQLLEQEARAAGIEDRVVVLEEGVTRVLLIGNPAGERGFKVSRFKVSGSLATCETWKR